jgi:hypothetical protein
MLALLYFNSSVASRLVFNSSSVSSISRYTRKALQATSPTAGREEESKEDSHITSRTTPYTMSDELLFFIACFVIILCILYYNSSTKASQQPVQKKVLKPKKILSQSAAILQNALGLSEQQLGQDVLRITISIDNVSSAKHNI